MTEQPSLSYQYAKRQGVLLQKLDTEVAVIAHRPDITPQTIAELRRHFQRPLQLVLLSIDEFNTQLAGAYEASPSSAQSMAESIEEEMDLKALMQHMPKTQDLLDSQDDAPIIRILNALFTQAIKQKASDIHIETFADKVIVRFRIDGMLQEVLTLQPVLAPLLISRVKVMAKLDIAEKRLPQDGRMSLHIGGHTIDVRVSTLPASYAERVVLRLLDKKNAHLDLSLLGMYPDTLQSMRELIAVPHGILLVTGPTGSGKTTSLYAMLNESNQPDRNILTVEDPIEYDLPGIGQTQVNTKIDMTFAKGLRAILRQDPDIVMIGEIRDLETAEIAIQASLTGHLVLSTLHTNSALGAITRLRDMGIDSFLLSSSLIGLIAQRLVRLLCPDCKTPRPADENEMLLLGQTNTVTIYEPTGCDACSHSGYRGRRGIYDLIKVDQPLRDMIHKNASEQTMNTYVRQYSMSMRSYGFRRVLDGETTIAEVLRVTQME